MRALQKVKAFPYVFYHSLTSPAYYPDILKTRIAFSIKYFVTLATLATLVTTLYLTYKVTPAVRQALDKTLIEFENVYPDDLVITSKNNQWAINKPEPVKIAMPLFQNTEDVFMPKNLIVFYKQGTMDDIKNLDTLVLVNEKNVLVQSNTNRNPAEWNGKLDVYPLQELPAGEFTKATLMTTVTKIEKISGFIELGIILIMGIFIFVYNFIYRGVYLLFVAALIFGLGRIVGLKNRYLDFYKIALHTMTLSVVAELIMLTTNTNWNIPSWFFIINILYSSVVILFIAKNHKHTSKA